MRRGNMNSLIKSHDMTILMALGSIEIRMILIGLKTTQEAKMITSMNLEIGIGM